MATNIKIRKGSFSTALSLEHAAVVAGFPSPADDYKHEGLDFNKDYIRHPEASFYGDVEGDSMKDAGIFDGGCVVARSNEAKALGIKAGTPYYQLEQQFPNEKIAVFSSNYELYGELTGRIVDIIREEAPTYFRYSIDECFVYWKGVEDVDLKDWGERLHRKIRRWVGMPVSIGIAEQRLLTPTSSTITIVQAAKEALRQIYRQGYKYKKAGVIVIGVAADNPIQHDLFDIKPEQYDKLKSLDDVLDRINRLYGTETLVVGSQQYTQKEGKGKADVFANAIKHDFRSKNPTTRWSDVIKLK